MKAENEVVYMAIDWQSKQIPKRLGRVNWALAVRLCKKQNCYTVRLATSLGYNNQGSYIKTNN